MQTNVVYHANCLDGFGSAAIMHEYFNGKCNLIPYEYGREVNINRFRDTALVIVDFSFPLDTMIELAKVCKYILLIDHHKTAIPLKDHKWPVNVEVIIDESNEHYSGVGLTWRYCFGSRPMPKVLAAIQDRDIWQFKHSFTEEVTMALRIYEHDKTLIKQLVYDTNDLFFNELVRIGLPMRAKYNKELDIFEKQRYFISFAGYIVPCVNAPAMYASELGSRLAKDQPFAVVWQYNGRKFAISLRSETKGVDVSMIAKSLGGGGHRNAAGCSSDSFLFNPCK